MPDRRLALLALATACSGGGGDGDRFRVVFIADTHITGPQYECCSESNDLDNASIVRTEERLAEVVERINAITPAPDLVFVLGDVMHNPYYSLDPQWYYDEDSAWSITPTLLAGLNMPVHPLWGNHDYDVRCTGDHVSRDLTHQLFDHYFQVAPYYTVDHKGWRFVLGNSQLGASWNPADSGCDTGVGSYGADQLTWIDEQLADGRPTIFMSHYMQDVTATQEVPGAAAPDLETVLGQHDNLALHIAGHTHHWLDFLDAFPFPHVIIGGTRYDTDNFWVVELDAAGGYRFLDYDKAGRFAGCATTWTYDGEPAYLQPQPVEDGDC